MKVRDVHFPKPQYVGQTFRIMNDCPTTYLRAVGSDYGDVISPGEYREYDVQDSSDRNYLAWKEVARGVE